MEFKKKTSMIILFVILVIVNVSKSQFSFPDDNEDGSLNLTSILKKYGLEVEEYEVITEDGYILKLFRVPGDQSRPVLLVHGVIESAYTFVIRGNNSMTYVLAEKKYDVWLVSLRGIEFSREHINLNETDPIFWDFSFHENGYYDLPAIIDFILEKTGQNKLSAIGNSQGNTMFYVLGATRPEYNSKIRIMIALAPICFLSHIDSPIKELLTTTSGLQLLDNIPTEEVLIEGSFYRNLFNSICKLPFVGYTVCIRLFNSITGEDNEEFGPDIYYTLLGHFPATTSKKTYRHIIQNAQNDDFLHFDYGTEKNKVIYGTDMAPPYDLSKVTMNIALFAAKNDKLSHIEDVERLRDILPNVEYIVMEREKFNHIDYMWGRNMRIHLFPHVFEILEKYDT